MLVISDTTPIISLLKINRLDLLEKLFDSIVIPNGVFTELTSNKKFTKESDTIKKCSFIKPQNIINSQAVKILQKATGLDLGESEAIIMFNESNADLLLIDEKQGRKIADTMSIPHVGTIGILLQAFNEKFISASDVLSYIDTMKKNKIHIDENLVAIVKNKLYS